MMNCTPLARAFAANSLVVLLSWENSLFLDGTGRTMLKGDEAFAKPLVVPPAITGQLKPWSIVDVPPQMFATNGTPLTNGMMRKSAKNDAIPTSVMPIPLTCAPLAGDAAEHCDVSNVGRTGNMVQA
jgi:hypothetical protein